MGFDIALENLLVRKSKTAVSVAGVATSIVLIFMQLGFRGAVENTATTIYDQLEFDLIVRSPDYLHLADADTIDRAWLTRLQSRPGVERVSPLYTGMGNWKHPTQPSLHGILILAIDPNRSVFRSPEINAQTERLMARTNVLIDREASPSFGPSNGEVFGDGDIGVSTTVNDQPVRLAGTYQIGAGLTANGSIIASEAQFQQLLPIPVDRRVSMALIDVNEGNNPRAVKQEILEWLSREGFHPNEVEVLTVRDVRDRELDRWIRQTPIGFIFTLGVAISFLVGSAIVFSVMSNDVNRRIGEFATLKAMGFSNSMVCWIVLRQAIYLGVIAFIPSVGVAMIIYAVTEYLANIPIQMTIERAGFVLVLSLGMSCASGLAALRRVWRADPAALF